jgi:hypothetical protein
LLSSRHNKQEKLDTLETDHSTDPVIATEPLLSQTVSSAEVAPSTPHVPSIALDEARYKKSESALAHANAIKRALLEIFDNPEEYEGKTRAEKLVNWLRTFTLSTEEDLPQIKKALEKLKTGDPLSIENIISDELCYEIFLIYRQLNPKHPIHFSHLIPRSQIQCYAEGIFQTVSDILEIPKVSFQYRLKLEELMHQRVSNLYTDMQSLLSDRNSTNYYCSQRRSENYSLSENVMTHFNISYPDRMHKKSPELDWRYKAHKYASYLPSHAGNIDSAFQSDIADIGNRHKWMMHSQDYKTGSLILAQNTHLQNLESLNKVAKEIKMQTLKMTNSDYELLKAEIVKCFESIKAIESILNERVAKRIEAQKDLPSDRLCIGHSVIEEFIRNILAVLPDDIDATTTSKEEARRLLLSPPLSSYTLVPRVLQHAPTRAKVPTDADATEETAIFRADKDQMYCLILAKELGHGVASSSLSSLSS